MYVLTTSEATHQATLEAYEFGDRTWAWTVQSSLALGDLVLIYVTKPIGRFSWIGRARSHAERPERSREGYTAWLDLEPLPVGLGYEDARSEPALKDASLMKPRGLQRTSRRVPPEVWEGLISAIAQREPQLSDLLEAWRTPAAPIDESSFFVWGGDRTGSGFLFANERQLQERLKSILETSEGMLEPGPEDGTGLRAFEARMGPRNRADIVLINENHDPPRLVVVETKQFATGDEGLSQLQRYGAWLRENHPTWQLELILGAQLITPRIRAQARAAGMTCVVVRAWQDEDQLLPGDRDLTLDWSEPDHEVVTDEVEAARRTRAAIGALVSTPRVGVGDVHSLETPAGQGLLALWLDPSDQEGWEDLGVAPTKPGRPLMVFGCLDLPTALEQISGGYSAFSEAMRVHLSLVREAFPYPLFAGTDEDAQAKRAAAVWAKAHLSVSFVDTPGLIAGTVARAARIDLDPLFSGYFVRTLPEIAERFGDLAPVIDGVLMSLVWEDWVAALDDDRAEGEADTVAVAVDDALLPVGLVDDLSRLEGDELEVAVLERRLWSEAASLLRGSPPADRLDEAGRPPKDWAAFVDQMTPAQQVALVIAQEIRAMAVVGENADEYLGVPGRSPRGIALPGADSVRVPAIYSADDGSRRIVEAPQFEA